MSCPACEKEVSRNAKVCPHCGEPRPAESKEESWFDRIAVVAIIAGALFLFGKMQEKQRRDAAEIEAMKQEAAELIRQTKFNVHR